MIGQNQHLDTKNGAIITWLLSCCALVFCMVIVGAITRLSESGLSMVEWRPLIGFIPPLNDAEWQRVFDLYKQTPEFIQKNFWMGMADFQKIFFWEWAHRVLGRVIGLAYGLPLLWFWIRKEIPKGYGWPLLGMLCLGAAQGYMGWYMVKSGLVDNPAVSHYRLAAHLGLAFLIFACLLRTALSLGAFDLHKPTSTPLMRHLYVLLFIYSLTVFWGAYTAGLDAGLIYNDTFPHMGDSLIPYDFHLYQPWFVNLFENHSGVQFAHRWLAISTIIAGLSYSYRHWKLGTLNPASLGLGAIITAQFILGLVTLFTQVNLIVATLHQGTALLVLAIIIINTKSYKSA